MKFSFIILSILFLCGCRSITRTTADFIMPPNTVIFSFDDGPNPVDDTTVRLLDVLKKYEVKALFALFGDRSEDRPDLVRLIYNEGHFIINHGYSDKHSKKMNDDEFRDNLIRGGEAIFAALEKELEYKMYRPHGGFYNSRQLEICLEEGYTIIPANIRVYDAVVTGRNQKIVSMRVINKVSRKNRGIILLHDARDSHERTAEMLDKNRNVYDRSWIPETVEEIIIALLAKGYIIGSPELIKK